MKDITLVLGVHRSGTSVLTAGLKAIGVGLGTFPEFKDDDNPKGYFEHVEIRDFNDRLLSHLGASWDNWGFFALSEGLDGPDFADWRKEAADLLGRCFPGPGPYAIKDPRISQVLPFWLTVLDELGWRHRRVLVLRPPEEVAESQRQRAVRRPGEFPVISHPEAMCALWSVTMYSLLGSLRDDETLLVSHASLYSDTADIVQACADFIGVRPNVGAVRQFADTFVNPAFRRATDPADRAVGAWEKLARNLYEACGAGDQPKRLSRAEAAALYQSQDALAVQVGYLSAARASIGRLKASADRVAIRNGAQMHDLRLALQRISVVAINNAPPGALANLLQKLEEVSSTTTDPAIGNVCAIIADKTGDKAGAETIMRRLIAANPGNPNLSDSLARMFDSWGRVQDAKALRGDEQG